MKTSILLLGLVKNLYIHRYMCYMCQINYTSYHIFRCSINSCDDIKKHRLDILISMSMIDIMTIDKIYKISIKNLNILKWPLYDISNDYWYKKYCLSLFGLRKNNKDIDEIARILFTRNNEHKKIEK